MPKYAMQPQWKSRRSAIGKKCELDFELLCDSELIITDKNRNKLTLAEAASPTSVATASFIDVPEMKPLPGAWVVVGKGGRPVHANKLMYNEPTEMQKKKRKKRVRAPKDPMSEDLSILERLADLECSTPEPSARSVAKAKYVSKAKEAKHWARYHQAKQLKVLACDTLVAALADGGQLCDESDEEVTAPEPLKRRTDKGSSRAAKLRRKARFASQNARSYSVEMDEEEMSLEPRPEEKTAQVRGMGSRDAEKASAMSARELLGGKPMERESSEVSSLHSSLHSSFDSPTASSSASARNGKAKQSQCSVM